MNTSNRISLTKKIFQYLSATEEEYIEWLKIVGLEHLSVDDRKKLLNLDKKTRTKLINHTKMFGYNVVTIEKILTCPNTSNSDKIRKHYGLLIEKKDRPNVYDPHYISKRDNITLDEATEYIIKYKANKATNLSNFIKKYGDEEGKILYEEWFNKSLGKGIESENRTSHYTVDYWKNKGYNDEEAWEIACKTQRENSSLYIDYYLIRGKTIEEAKSSIRKIHDKKLGKCSVTEKILRENPDISEEDLKIILREKKDSSSYNKLGEEKYLKKLEKMRKTFEEKGIWVPFKDLSDWELYKKLVWHYTNLNDLKSLQHYEKRGHISKPDAYQLDHKFSLSRGYIEGIHPSLIGSLANIHFIPATDNRKKWTSCSISKEELYENQKNT